MIFLTVGSHEPFDRLVAAIDRFAEQNPQEEVFGQITTRAEYRPVHIEWTETLDPIAYAQACARADVLVAHAGMGSIITALDVGRPIVVMPRRGHLKETRNDHQFLTARKFADKPGIFVAENEDCLPSAMGAALDAARAADRCDGAASGLAPYAEDRLIAFLRRVST